jgi:hypothetical protein
MGNPMLCVGATFTVVPKYSNRFLHGQVINIGKIGGVVRQKGSSVPWFRFYDFEKYPFDAPQRGTSEYMYIECAAILSTDSKKTGIKWTRRNSVSKQIAKKPKTFFEMEYGPARGFEDELDTIRAKRIEAKKAVNKPTKHSDSGSSSESIASSETESDSEAEEIRELKDDSDENDSGEDDSYYDDVLAKQMEYNYYCIVLLYNILFVEKYIFVNLCH